MRHILAAAALTLGVVSIVMIRSLQWEGLIVLFVGSCLWWIALHLSRSAWHARRASDQRPAAEPNERIPSRYSHR